MEADGSANASGKRRKTTEERMEKRRKREENVLSKLECPVCYVTMLPPIRQCNEGHNLCERCCTRLLAAGRPSEPPKCPTCRITLKEPVARARNLEDVAIEANIQVMCDMPGCGESIRYSEISQHKQTCAGRTVLCPLKRCGWRGEPSGLAVHLQCGTSADGQPRLRHSLPITISHRLSRRQYIRAAKCSLTFHCNRPAGDPRPWRPQRQLIRVPAEPPSSRRPDVDSQEASFCIALWKDVGERAPFCAAVQELCRPDAVQPAWRYKISLLPQHPSEPPNDAASFHGCIFEAQVPRLDVRDVWLRPALHECASSVMLVSAQQMAHFNGGDATSKQQVYKLDVVLSRLSDSNDNDDDSDDDSDDDDSDDNSDDDSDDDVNDDDDVDDDDDSDSDDGSDSDDDSDDDI